MWRPEGSPSEHIISGVSSLLVTPQGDPTVPYEVEKAIKARHPRLKIEWLKAAWGMSAFVIKEEWGPNDKRREEIRRGERDPSTAFDILARFPPGISTNDMLGWIENNLGFQHGLDPVKEAERIVAEAQKRLAEVRSGQVDQTIQTGEDRYVREDSHDRAVRAGVEKAHPMVSGADFTDAPKRLLIKD